jgi:hypothetical protein
MVSFSYLLRPKSLRALFIALLVISLAAPAFGHAERDVKFPSGEGSVPKYRKGGPTIVICKPDSDERIAKLPPRAQDRNEALLEDCRFKSLQAAVNHVRKRGTRILVLPGVYHEQRVLGKQKGECAELEETDILSYKQQRECPHVQNLVAILGDGPDKGIECDNRLCDLQIEGTGSRPEDVIFNGRFKKLNVIRGDRVDGLYLRNFTTQYAHFNAIYIMQTDGFVIDRLVGRWNDEYGFLTFASDHGLYKNCEAYVNGDSGVYPGAAAPHHGARPSIEIRRCRSHHNMLGYSGTAGDSTYVHHNKFYKNGVGIVTDSFFPNHPGLPQNSATFVHNKIWSNNKNYYKNYDDGDCDKPSRKRGYKERGVVCPAIPAPVGTGLLIAGGNANMVANNHIWDQWRFGTMLFWVPAAFREEHDPAKQMDTSHFNRYLYNTRGVSPRGEEKPNGLDFWWDEEGAGNCWMLNEGGEDGISSDPAELPHCDDSPVLLHGDPAKTALLGPCATWDRESNNHPPGCDWMEKPEKPEE